MTVAVGASHAQATCLSKPFSGVSGEYVLLCSILASPSCHPPSLEVLKSVLHDNGGRCQSACVFEHALCWEQSANMTLVSVLSHAQAACWSKVLFESEQQIYIYIYILSCGILASPSSHLWLESVMLRPRV